MKLLFSLVLIAPYFSFSQISFLKLRSLLNTDVTYIDSALSVNGYKFKGTEDKGDNSTYYKWLKGSGFDGVIFHIKQDTLSIFDSSGVYDGYQDVVIKKITRIKNDDQFYKSVLDYVQKNKFGKSTYSRQNTIGSKFVKDQWEVCLEKVVIDGKITYAVIIKDLYYLVLNFHFI
jgi:hypothetical protein